jgi:hypothetical protein
MVFVGLPGSPPDLVGLLAVTSAAWFISVWGSTSNLAMHGK